MTAAVPFALYDAERTTQRPPPARALTRPGPTPGAWHSRATANQLRPAIPTLVITPRNRVITKLDFFRRNPSCGNKFFKPVRHAGL